MNAHKNQRPLLAIVVTSPMSTIFFKGQIEYLQNAGFSVAVICSPGWKGQTGIPYYPISMEREISIFKDLFSLWSLIRLFVKIKPDIVNAGTPKAGLLATVAAYLCRVPIRIYTCHGLRLETLAGWKKVLLTATEKTAAFCAHKVICVSPSLRNKVVQMRLTTENKAIVIGSGSCNGVDLGKYNPLPAACEIDTMFAKYGVFDKNACIIGFVGRLTKDKGIYELIEAFEILKPKFPNLLLLLLGGIEEGDPLSPAIRAKIIQDERIIDLGEVSETIPYYRCMKLLVLPTYREGLPTVLLEAGAMAIPVVATMATGCVDIVVDRKTGLLAPARDATALANSMEILIRDHKMAEELGKNARERIRNLFSQEIVWENTTQFYLSLLSS